MTHAELIAELIGLALAACVIAWRAKAREDAE